MKVAVFNTKSYDREYLDKFNIDNKHQLNYFETAANALTANLASGHEAVCVFVNDKLDLETIKVLSSVGVKLIALRCAGFNNVDIAAAAASTIKVVRVPAYSPQAVAEHTVALILTLNRKTHKAYNRVRESNFSVEQLMGFNLYGKTIGVIGTGKIGSTFCSIMLAFGCTVIAYDIKQSTELITKGVSYKTFDEVLHQSDIISLHCPLTPQTQYLFNSDAFTKLKKGVMLINTSRGKLINTVDAIEALKNKQLGYLGIDVYEQEENLFFKDLSETVIDDDLIERLMSFHNVLITPHQAFFTKESLDEIALTTLKNISDFDGGLPLVNEVKLAG